MLHELVLMKNQVVLLLQNAYVTKELKKHILQSRTSAHEWAFHLDLSKVNSQNRAHVYSLDVAGDALRV